MIVTWETDTQRSPFYWFTPFCYGQRWWCWSQETRTQPLVSHTSPRNSNTEDITRCFQHSSDPNPNIRMWSTVAPSRILRVLPIICPNLFSFGRKKMNNVWVVNSGVRLHECSKAEWPWISQSTPLCLSSLAWKINNKAIKSHSSCKVLKSSGHVAGTIKGFINYLHCSRSRQAILMSYHLLFKMLDKQGGVLRFTEFDFLILWLKKHKTRNVGWRV